MTNSDAPHGTQRLYPGGNRSNARAKPRGDRGTAARKPRYRLAQCAASVCLLLFASAAADARSLETIIERGTLKLCAHPNALPFASKTGPVSGIQTELGEKIAQQLGVKLTREWVATAIHYRRADCDLVLDAIIRKDVPPRPELPTLAEDIIEAVSENVPDYRRDLAGTFGRNLRLGVEAALGRFCTMVEGGTDEGPGSEVYVELGRVEMRAGRSLNSLLAAYRLGARVAWRRYAEVGERAGLEPQTLYLLAESVFAYIDEISGESIEGWTAEQAAAAGERQRRRRRLAGLLIQDPPADPTSIEAEAVAAGWPLPDRVAALVVEGEDPDRLAMRLGGEAIATATVRGLCALVPTPTPPGAGQSWLRRWGTDPRRSGTPSTGARPP